MAHHHHHGHPVAGKRLGLSVAITVAFVLGEITAAFFSHSLALFSDAGHNFADALALIFSWYAVRVASRPSNSRRTFGYHRVGILAALANAGSLALIALFIFWEALQRLQTPQSVQVHGSLMAGVALVAVFVNTVIALGLHGEAKHDLNMRSAYMHMLGDAVSACLVVVAGLLVTFTGSSLADGAVSLVIGGLILWSSWGILVEAVNVLLESAPSELDMCAVEKAIDSVSGVLNVHDLHVWTVSSGILACSCHILVAEQSIRSGQQVLRAVTTELERRFRITHSTVQIEVEGCEASDMYCTMRVLHAAHAHDHGHEDHERHVHDYPLHDEGGHDDHGREHHGHDHGQGVAGS